MIWNPFKKRPKINQNEVLEKLSNALAYSEPELHSFIEIFIRSRAEFHSKHGGLKEFRGIDVSSLTDTEHSEEEIFQAFFEFYQNSANLLIADWSSSISDIEHEINDLFSKHSIPQVSNFCIFHIAENDDPSKIFEKLSQHVSKSGKKLIGLQTHEDSHNCAIVLESQFPEIRDIVFEDGVYVFAW